MPRRKNEDETPNLFNWNRIEKDGAGSGFMASKIEVAVCVFFYRNLSVVHNYL